MSNNCGDDTKTRTKYRKEKNVGDRLKVILLQFYDFIEVDNLQTAEILALCKNLLDEHIIEVDELDG